MIELNVSNRWFVKYLEKIDIKSKREIFCGWFGFNRCYAIADCWKKRIRSSIFSSNCFRCFLWSDFLWHSLSSRNRWSVSVSLSFRDARQRASLLVYTLFEDSRSSSSIRAITCFFLRKYLRLKYRIIFTSSILIGVPLKKLLTNSQILNVYIIVGFVIISSVLKFAHFSRYFRKLLY